MPLTSTLYRQLLRAARQHDAHPQLKAMLSSPLAHGVQLGQVVQIVSSVLAKIRHQRKTHSAQGQGQGEPPATATGKPTTKEATKGAEEGEHKAADAPPAPADESYTALVNRCLHAAKEAEWRRHTSPTLQRCMDAAFRGKAFYWPECNFARLTRDEFRRGREEVAAARKKAAAASKAKRPSTPASSSSDAALSHHWNDGFSLLRMLNKNHTAHSSLVSAELEGEVDHDPAEPWLNSNAGSTDVMRPTESLAAGSFLVAHPLMGSPWKQCVLLLLKHDASGSVGVLVNRPAPFVMKSRVRGTAGAVHLLASSPVRLGGPVKSCESEVTDMYLVGQATTPSATVVLHRIPALADISRPIRTSGEGTMMWMINTNEAFLTAVSRLIGITQGEEALQNGKKSHQTKDDSKESMSATPKSSASTASSSSSPLDSLLSSDFLAFHGVCTWDAGQLETEVDDGSWVLSTGSPDHVFGAQTEDTSSRADDEEELDAVWVFYGRGTGAKRKDVKRGATERQAMLHTEEPAARRKEPFPLQHLWAHAMYQRGGEHRAFARIPFNYDPTTQHDSHESHES